jgi:hypothetical protein
MVQKGQEEAAERQTDNERRTDEQRGSRLTRLPPGAGAVLAGDVPAEYMAGAIATGLRGSVLAPQNSARWLREQEPASW